MKHINKAKKLIKGKLCYDIIMNKALTLDEKRKKIAKYNEMLQDNKILLEYIKVAKNVLKEAQFELEKIILEDEELMKKRKELIAKNYETNNN